MANSLTSPHFQTARVQIQHLSQTSSAKILDYYRHNEAFLAPTSALKAKDFYTLPYWQTQIDRSKTECQEGSAIRFIVYVNQDPETIIGTANITQIFRGAFQAAYLGFSLCAEHQGKGIMQEAISPILSYAFDDLNIHRIMANHLTDNHRSGALLARLGFEIEGIAKAYLHINGAWRDHVLTSKTNLNWRSE